MYQNTMVIQKGFWNEAYFYFVHPLIIFFILLFQELEEENASLSLSSKNSWQKHCNHIANVYIQSFRVVQSFYAENKVNPEQIPTKEISTRTVLDSEFIC